MNHKVALVTGGCSGIGLAIANKFLNESWELIIIDINPLPLELENKCIFLKIDLENEDDVINGFSEIEKSWNHIDAVVNCAGIIEKGIGLDGLEANEFRKVLNVNLIGSFLICKYSLSFLQNSKQGNIINIGSISAVHKVSNYLAYSVSKAGILSLTLVLAKQLAKYGIRVNLISPGSVVNTGFWEKQYGRKIDFYEEVQLINQSPLKKLNFPEGIANVVYFLVSDEASQITGANIVVDSGLSL
ncbi:SDR family NAD(P)-dependent oxidoreductase [Sporanaerobacter acetigenes]|uniref:SDR family NAD(P)-dependent oxidoreductase n=1 Tax=Sporanaerobacter acetigenes TaxID=165813 RepID=UPI00104DF473|nr:SDR family oxidoreductase [Sporanaerobacter acetigenes]